MTPSRLKETVVLDRIRWVRKMLTSLQDLPLKTWDAFNADDHISAAAESYLRRGLEALLDLGRHLLAKGFGVAPPEYKSIAITLGEKGVLTKEQTALFIKMAGYRNRLVHFYHEISRKELYEICSQRLGDIESILEAIQTWIDSHPQKIDRSL